MLESQPRQTLAVKTGSDLLYPYPRQMALGEFVVTLNPVMKIEPIAQGSGYHCVPEWMTEIPQNYLLDVIDLLKPDTSYRFCQKQDNMELSRHTGSKVRMFTMGQSVMVRDYRGKTPWIHATVMSSLGPLTYQLKNR